MMASMSMMGGRGSSLRTWSSLSVPSISTARPLYFPLLRRAPHFYCAGLVLTPARPYSSSSSTPSSPLFPVVQASQLEERVSAEDAISSPKARTVHHKFPVLSPKEKKDLRAYAHSLGKKIISQQIGKAGVTEALAKAISDALESKEILKLKVLDNCPDELKDVITKIEESTQGQVVGKIGSVITLYRPSLRKLSEAKRMQDEAEERRPRRPMGRRVRSQ